MNSSIADTRHKNVVEQSSNKDKNKKIKSRQITNIKKPKFPHFATYQEKLTIERFLPQLTSNSFDSSRYLNEEKMAHVLLLQDLKFQCKKCNRFIMRKYG